MLLLVPCRCSVMNREIKFKAWDKDKCKMIEWEELINYCDIDYLFGNIGLNSKRDTIPDLEIMQYSGLKDKFGVEVYDGDFIKTRKGNIQQVQQIIETVNGTTFISGFYAWDEGKQKWMALDITDEVIGNIYEDKDILEEYFK